MQLEIYITNQCTNCEEALLIAERARGIAGLEVAVIDLDQPGQYVPPRVVAVPTSLLNGRIVSLGNPKREEFLGELRQLPRFRPKRPLFDFRLKRPGFAVADARAETPGTHHVLWDAPVVSGRVLPPPVLSA